MVNNDTGFGYIYGIASGSQIGVLNTAPVRYGDIGELDLVALITAGPRFGSYSRADFKDFDISDASETGLSIVRGPDSKGGQIVSGEIGVAGSVARANNALFGKTGLMYVAPDITSDMLTQLRNGERLKDGATGSFSVTVAIKGERHTFIVITSFTDFGMVDADNNGKSDSVFFGDRKLDNPGYSKFELKGAVGVNQTNNVLEVWRVEQRLKYLGFPAIGASNELGAPSWANNEIQNFDVDGSFGEREQRALKLFEKTVRYDLAHTRFNNTDGTVDNSNGADGLIEAGNAGQGQLTEDWLNAYNAPHWMSLFGEPVNSKPIDGWFNSQDKVSSPPDDSQESYQAWKQRTGQVERYGTSWVRDLMVAASYAPTSLQVNGIDMRFNGATDANYGFTPGAHVTHDLGMAFDLGLSQYVLRNPNQNDGSQTTPNIQIAPDDPNPIPGSGWSVDRAVAWSARLPDRLTDDGGAANGQQQALRDFLALYSVTRADGGGVWGQLPVVNTGARAALFGEGTLADGLISNVVIGGTGDDQNSYANIRYILQTQLQIPNTSLNATYPGAARDHQNHFHVFLSPPTRVDLPRNLLADEAASGIMQAIGEVEVASASLQAAAQTMLNQFQPDVGFEEGEVTMFIMDMPDVPPQYQPVMLVQAAQSPQTKAQYDRLVGVCHPIESAGMAPSAVNSMEPVGSLKDYFRLQEKKTIEGPSTVTVLEQPKHGKLEDRGTFVIDHGVRVDTGERRYRYLPNPGYVTGQDRAVLLVEIAGLKVKMVYTFHVVDVLDDESDEIYCPSSYERLPDESQSDAPVSSGTTQSWSLDLSGIPNVEVNIADLPGGALGQATGLNITLDANAGGYNWYIDATPWDNSEYLATSNPNEWVAKVGSAAEGKMDMLSVLLHEYGHALGIEHSADNHDYMATTLTPGVRRMPSAEELALMQQLIGQAKDGLASATPLPNPLPQGERGLPDAPNPFPTLPLGGGFGLAFLGRLRSSRFGSMSIAPDYSTLVTQYAVSANATFTNLNTPAGWNTQGGVDITPSTGSGQSGMASATLSEVSTSQTRLSQVFTLNERDRYLSFKLSGTVLDNLTGAPDDAFEVALLDANTGTSLLGNDGLTRTDAIINLQGDGSEHAASSVTRINNGDGSRTYRVDLTGIAAGTVANLSFDLLGFGASNSHLTLSDIRVSGLPQLHDDAATLAEDNLLSFDPFTQADAQLRLLLASHIVDGPTHGALVINADGTFSYTPDLNYFGSDSFSYRLSDGPLDSNLAIVSLTVTPVNDAPVVADIALSTAEDTALVITLGSPLPNPLPQAGRAERGERSWANGAQGAAPTLYASDVDSTTLTPHIVTGPAHGMLTQNTDGTYSYTPSANYNGADSFTYRVNDGALDSNIATVMLAVTSMNDAPMGTSATVTGIEVAPYIFKRLRAFELINVAVLKYAHDFIGIDKTWLSNAH